MARYAALSTPRSTASCKATRSDTSPQPIGHTSGDRSGHAKRAVDLHEIVREIVERDSSRVVLNFAAESLWIADILMMMDAELSRRSSSDTRHALTVAFVKSSRDARRNHAKNSSSAMLYTRFVIGDETESSTIAFNLPICWLLDHSRIVHFSSFSRLLLALSELTYVDTTSIWMNTSRVMTSVFGDTIHAPPERLGSSRLRILGT
jgi:hypothetical protein